MTSLRRRLLVKAFIGFDLWVMAASLYIALLGRNALEPLAEFGRRTIHVHTVVALATLLYVWRVALDSIGLHQSHRLTNQKSEFLDVLKASGFATLLLVAIAFCFRLRGITPAVTLRFLLMSFSLLIGSRLLMRPLLKAIRRRGRNLRHLVIAGTNARAVEFANSILARPELGYRLEGFVDTAWFGPHLADDTVNIVCGIEQFRAYLREHVVDELVISLPLKSFYAEADELVEVCREQGIIVRLLSDLFNVSRVKTRIDQLGANPVVSFYDFPIDGIPVVGKRILDVIVSATLLLILSPVLLLTTILVKLSSSGPALFAQERVGLNKRPFRMYKFRTMVVGAEKLQAQLESLNEAQGPVFKIKNDPRITRIGKILRKTSIDELPQLLNVLKGEMSLVGPRPLPVRDYNGFNQDWQRRRFSVRPGITCLWQVSGRSGISFDQWMNLDMEYIDNWSIWLDMKILAKTVPAVVKGSGAA